MKTYKIFANQKHFIASLTHRYSDAWSNYSTHNERNAADFKAAGMYLVRAEIFTEGGLYYELTH